MTAQGASTGSRRAGGSRRPWQALRDLSDRTSLRTKLITALLALVAVALVAISVSSGWVLRSYLTSQDDHQLKSVYNGIVSNDLISNNPDGFQPVPGQVGQVKGTNVLVGVQEPGNPLSIPGGQPGIGSWNGFNVFQSLPAVPTSLAWANANNGELVTVQAQSGHDTWRVITGPVSYTLTTESGTQQVNGTLVVGIDLGNINATIGRLAATELIVGLIIVCILAVAIVAVVRANLRPLVEIEETAGEIADGHLNRRVPERDPRTEIGRLGRSLNRMLSQIEAAFHAREESEAAAHQSEERMRRFVADASHELRTPLTAIRGFAEYYRQRGGMVAHWDREQVSPAAAQAAEGPGPAAAGGQASSAAAGGQASSAAAGGQASSAAASSVASPQGGSGGMGPPGREGAWTAGGGLTPDDLDRIMQRLEKEAARMGLLVEDLLLLARLDQQRPLARQPIDLLSLAADAVHDARLLAPSRNIDLSVQPGAAFLVIGDEPRLRQVIGNLMSNALTHTPDGTPIEVSIGSGTLDPRVPGSPPAVTLDVTDQGPGMTTEQAHRVFERFYRADQARTRATGGSGLGLAIVNALVTAHGGVASVRTAPGRGATFRIALPLAPEAQHGMTDDDSDLDELDADAEAEADEVHVADEAGKHDEAGGSRRAQGYAGGARGGSGEVGEDAVTFGAGGAAGRRHLAD
jgi:two-component system OmpR family sensor kinase